MSSLDTQLNLLDPDFIQRAHALRVVARRVAPGGRWADQRSLDRGAGIEFRDYRPYAAGDDLRAIDWNIYLRLGRIVIRLFEELEDLPIYLLPDVSRSMWLDDPPRAHAALRSIVALAAIGLDQHDAVGVFPCTDELSIAMRPGSGHARLLEIASILQQVAQDAANNTGQTNLAASLAQFRGLGLREGLVVVVSDFFDPAGADAIIDELKRTRHRTLMIPIMRSNDREPDIGGDLRLRDCESGVSLDVSITESALQRYRDAYDRHMDALRAYCRRSRGGFLPIDANEDVIEQFARLFEGGRYEA